MSDRPLRVGVIGVGSIARVAQLPVLAAHDDVEIVGITSRTEESRRAVARRYNLGRSYRSADELLAEGRLDAAFVLTPKETHAEIVSALLDAGVHVFCEKPMATDLGAARALSERAASVDRVLMIGFNRRYAPVYERAKAAFGDGRADVCVLQKNRPGSEYRASLENLIHMVDLARFLLGECVDLTAVAQYDDPYRETTLLATLTFEGGSRAVVLGNRSCGQWMERVEMYGAGLTVTVDAPDRVSVTDGDAERRVEATPLASGWAAVVDKMGFKGEVDHFVNCVRTGAEPRTGGRDALRTHELMYAILRAAGLPAE